MPANQKLLEVHDLSIEYLSGNKTGKAVEKTSLELRRGEVFGLAGESGCGKSTLAWSILRLLPTNARITSGKVIFEGMDLLNLPEQVMNKEIRGKKISMITQNPQGALNPVFSIYSQMADIFCHYNKGRQPILRPSLWRLFQLAKGRGDTYLCCVEMLQEMEIADAGRRIFEYPHQLSGGMKQRVLIAMSFIINPLVLIADEPTTALDVSVQASILGLLKKKINTCQTATIFITHDLRILSEIADKVAIMYAGRIVEQAPTTELFFHNPLHPYTKALIKCLPTEEGLGERLEEIPGRVPSIFEHPKNCCIFQPRCSYSTRICTKHFPPVTELSPSHFVRCFNLSQVK